MKSGFYNFLGFLACGSLVSGCLPENSSFAVLNQSQVVLEIEAAAFQPDKQIRVSYTLRNNSSEDICFVGPINSSDDDGVLLEIFKQQKEKIETTFFGGFLIGNETFSLTKIASGESISGLVQSGIGRTFDETGTYEIVASRVVYLCSAFSNYSNLASNLPKLEKEQSTAYSPVSSSFLLLTKSK